MTFDLMDDFVFVICKKLCARETPPSLIYSNQDKKIHAVINQTGSTELSFLGGDRNT